MAKFYIIIPTRNRHDTLYHSIKSALMQDYDDIEIVISDNNSSKETKEVVYSFRDSRLRYQRSERPLSMVNSWEYALSAVKGVGYVHFMGDDNGLLPDACSFASNTFLDYGARVLLADPIQYVWPNNDRSCYLRIPRRSETIMVSSLNALRLSYMLAIGFSRLPTINSSFVHTSVIEKVRNETNGRYFIACNPDVYSAVMNAAVEESYLLTNYPFVVNGASRHSNGASGAIVGTLSQFAIDNLNDGYKYHHLFPVSSSYYLNVYEAFAYALQTHAVRRWSVQINYQEVLNRLVTEEYCKMGRTRLEDVIKDFASLNNLRVPDLIQLKHKWSKTSLEPIKSIVISKTKFEIYNLADLIPDVYQAGIVAKEILSTKLLNKDAKLSLRDIKDRLVFLAMHKPWISAIFRFLIKWLSKFNYFR